MSSVAASLWKGDATHQGISGFLGAKNTVGTVLFGAIAGGAGADFTGGNFWQGAVTGGIVAGLNHALHDGGDSTDPPKKGKTSDGKYYGGDGSGSFSDMLSRFVYETDQWNPIALAWDGIKGSLTGTDRYGNPLTSSQSTLKLATAIPIGRVASVSTKLSNRLTYQVINRSSKGADGALSRHIIERLDNKVISKTHQVINNGKIIHQHQHHIGTYGTIRQFPESWINYQTK